MSLEELGSGQLLSDDHSMLILLVLPVPAIVGITPQQASVSSETGIGEAEQQLLQLRIDFDWGVVAGTPELELYRWNYLSAVRCRLGVLGAELSKNLTWSGSSQLACHFQVPLHAEQPQLQSHPNYHQCVEVSLNGGRSYTSACS